MTDYICHDTFERDFPVCASSVRPKRKGVLSLFLVDDIHHFDMGTLLDRLGIAVRTGHHCAQPLMQRLGIEGTVRASFGLYNTKEEINVFGSGYRACEPYVLMLAG